MLFTFNVYEYKTRVYLGSVRAKTSDEAEKIAAERFGVKVYLRMCM